MVLAADATAVLVTMREGNAGEGKSSVVTEGEEGDIDVGRELTVGGEDHASRNCHRAYPDNHPRSRALASWEVASLLPHSLTLTSGTHIALTAKFTATVPGRL